MIKFLSKETLSKKLLNTIILYTILSIRKDDREADGTALLMRRSHPTTEGSNPSLSEYIYFFCCIVF